MESCDILIVGGGPAGSSCAWKLRNAGLDVVIMDRSVFPRDKVCGGWITPEVLRELEIDPEEYGSQRALQPITGFRTGAIQGTSTRTDYGDVVSYGIRRCQFDHFLLTRSGARLLLGVHARTFEHCDKYWVINGQIRTRLLVGAGGHFCPVASFIRRSAARESAVVAQEVEFEMDESQRSACSVSAAVPELYFCADLKGYGWCFRKGNFLNVGLGRADPSHLTQHVRTFLQFLISTGRVGFEIPALRGHAYLLYGASGREPVREGALLVGDAAGLAHPLSGEGILPAIESGLLAAQAILSNNEACQGSTISTYRTLLEQRFGKPASGFVAKYGRHLPARLIQAISPWLLRNRLFARRVVLDSWFLHNGAAASSD